MQTLQATCVCAMVLLGRLLGQLPFDVAVMEGKQGQRVQRVALAASHLLLMSEHQLLALHLHHCWGEEYGLCLQLLPLPS